jgi:hypothetical protein
MPETIWTGLATPNQNIVWEEAYDAKSCVVYLPDIANVPMQIGLPATTNKVYLFSPLAMIWFGADAKIPGPIPDPIGGTVVGADVFRNGGIVMPGFWTPFTFQDTGTEHALHLVSREPAAVCYITALTEYAPF